MEVVDVCNRTKYGYSLVNINQPMVVDVIDFQVPKTPTLSLYIWQTAEWIEMKLIPIGRSSKNLHNACRLFSRHVDPS
jgi:hypothetical protein